MSGLVERASEDATYREQLLREPGAVVRAALGGELPAGIEIRVVADEPGVRHILLPFAARPVADEVAALTRLPESTPATRDFYARVFQDPDFRRRATAEPRAAIGEVLARHGQSLPQELEFRVLEETATVRYLVLPHVAPEQADDELSDADLELVAGGVTGGGATDFSRYYFTAPLQGGTPLLDKNLFTAC